MLKWLILLALMLPLGYWALTEKEEKVQEIDGLRMPWTRDDIHRLVRLDFKNSTHAVTALIHPTGYWWLLEPEKGMANQYTIQRWKDLWMAPKVMRWMNPTLEQQNELDGAVEIVAHTADKKVIKMKYYEPIDREKVAMIYIEDQNTLYIVERQIEMVTDLDVANYRTKRLFPFMEQSITQMTYEIDLKTFTLKRHEKGWEIDFQMTPAWQQLIQSKYNAMGEGFVARDPEDQMSASWEYTFESGNKAKLELCLTSKGYAVFYVGRDLGHLINSQTLRVYFPGVVERVP